MTAEERGRGLLCALEKLARTARPFGNNREDAFDAIADALRSAREEGRREGAEAMTRLATEWESKAIWLRHHADGNGARARAGVYNECADAVRSLSASPGTEGR